MEQIKTKDIVAEIYESVFEFAEVIRNRPTNKVFEKARLSSMEEGYASWYGTDTLDEANELLEKGYDKGCEDLYCELNLISKSQTKKPKLDVVGYVPCVPAFLQGQPENMYNKRPAKCNTRVITINYERSQDSGVSSDTIFKTSSKLLAAINTLEKKGFRVTLYVISGNCSSSQIAICSVKIKDYKERLNLMMVAYPLVHTAFDRRHNFRWLETCPLITNEKFTYSYGSALGGYFGSSEKEVLVKNNIINENDAFLSIDSLKRKSEQEILDEITAQCKL